MSQEILPKILSGTAEIVCDRRGLWTSYTQDYLMFGVDNVLIAIYKDHVAFSDDDRETIRRKRWEEIHKENLPKPFYWSIDDILLRVWVE